MLALFAVAALLAPLGGVPVGSIPTVVAPATAQAPLRITLNNGGDFTPGDRVRVQVEAAEDGFLIVFRVDGDGRVRVLFPIDPDLDPFVRGGRRYELRGRAERETFLADDRGGNGLIYAALSQEPLDFRRYASDDHWDYNTIRLTAWDADAEPELTDLVKRMAGSGRFTYDVLGYRVHGDVYISGGAGVVTPAGYGSPFYDPYWSCLACGYGVRGPGVNINVGIGLGNRWDYFDPWGRYDPWFYDRYRYGYGYGYGGFYDPWGWNYPGQYRPITVINLPRPQVPNTAYGYRARPRGPVPGGLAPDLTRVVRGAPRPGEAQPATGGRARSRDDQPSRATPRPNEPQRQDRTQGSGSSAPDRGSSRPSSNPPASSPPPSTPPASGTRARPRPGGGEALSTAPAQVDAPQMDRRGDSRPVVEPVAAPTRRVSEDPMPVFREPFRARPDVNAARGEPQRTEPQRAEPQRVEPSRSQPVYREPPRAEPQRAEPQRAEPRRAAPQREERQAPPQRAEPQRSEPQRTERPAPPRSEPVSRAAPPSSPPPAAPPAPTSGRSRPRP